MDNDKDNDKDNDNQPDINLYIDQLSDVEKKVIVIAKEVLGDSFNIERSLGYFQWKNTITHSI